MIVPLTEATNKRKLACAACRMVRAEGGKRVNGPRRPVISATMPAKTSRGSAASAIWKMA